MNIKITENITKQDLVEIFDYLINENYIEFPAHQFYRTVAIFHKDKVRLPDCNNYALILFLGDYIITATDQVPVRHNMRNAIQVFKLDYQFQCFHRNYKIRDRMAYAKYMDWWDSDRNGFKYEPGNKQPANKFTYFKHDRSGSLVSEKV
jgi:hypothetical protein